MKENPEQPPIEAPEDLPGKEGKESVEELEALFAEAEAAFEAEGREKGKLYLTGIYDTLIGLNKRDKSDWETLWDWNPEGDLTEEEFSKLDLRRRKLSNAIGIMTASGVVRHDLNDI